MTDVHDDMKSQGYVEPEIQMQWPKCKQLNSVYWLITATYQSVYSSQIELIGETFLAISEAINML